MDASITTITALVCADGNLDLQTLFWSLPILEMDPLPQKGRKKPKLPHGIPGSIIAAQYGKYFRGLKKSKDQKVFENSISIDLSLDKRNVCAKICSNKIHLSGVYSNESIELACGQLFAYFKLLESDFLYLSRLPIETKTKVINWIEYLFRENRPSRIHENIHLPPEVPQELDLRTAQIMLRNYFDFQSFPDQYLSWLQKISTVGFSVGERIPRTIINVDKLMTNYKFEIGQNILRFKLAIYLSKLSLPGLSARYNNTVNCAIKLLINNDTLFKELHPEYKTSLTTARKQGDQKPLHSFQIHASGKVMMTARDETTIILGQQIVHKILKDFLLVADDICYSVST